MERVTSSAYRAWSRSRICRRRRNCPSCGSAVFPAGTGLETSRYQMRRRSDLTRSSRPAKPSAPALWISRSGTRRGSQRGSSRRMQEGKRRVPSCTGVMYFLRIASSPALSMSSCPKQTAKKAQGVFSPGVMPCTASERTKTMVPSEKGKRSALICIVPCPCVNMRISYSPCQWGRTGSLAVKVWIIR